MILLFFQIYKKNYCKKKKPNSLGIYIKVKKY